LSRLRAGLLAAGLALAAFMGVANAQVTSLTLRSEPFDYIGGGQTYAYSAGDGTFSISKNYQGGVSIGFNSTGFTSWWYLDFSSGTGAPLTTGTYLNATRFPFNSGTPGLSVTGNGRGCNTLTGSFNVLEVTYGPNDTVSSFYATFQQNCEGGAAALYGEIRYNAFAPVYLTAPFNITVQAGQSASFAVTGTDSQQRRVYLTAPALPPGASFVDLGNSQGTFSWTPNSTQVGTYTASFQGDNRQGNVATTSTQITVIPPAPYNDDIRNAALITTVPFTASQVVTTATTAPDDPYCYGNAQSVWYAFKAPSTGRIELNTFGSGYDTTLAVFSGTPGALTQLACSGDAFNNFQYSLQSRVRFDAVAGNTYYIMVASQYYPAGTANLVLNVIAGPPAFSFNPTVNQFATVVTTTGAVTVSGTVQCTTPAFVYLSGSIRQMQGNVPLNGYWYVSVPCTGVTPWSAPVTAATAIFKGRAAALFRGGPAVVGVSGYGYDPDTGEYKSVNFTQTIRLRAK
jgi:hypothetical protein